MKTKFYLPEGQQFPILGLDTLYPSDQIGGGYSPDLSNVQVTKGELSTRKGYKVVGDGTVTLTDPVIATTEFEDIAGVKTLLAFTTKKQYKFNTGTQQWVNITMQTASVDVNWTGTEANPIDFCVCRGTNASGTAVKWIIICNGVDAPRYWDGGSGKFLSYLTQCDIPSLVTFQTIEYNFGHLILGNITTSAHDRQLIWWSDAGSLAKFTTGTSGSFIITDAQGEIMKLLNLGDRMAIYSENSLGLASYVGGSLIYSIEQIVHQTRLVSSRGIVNVGPYHLFLSSENIYLFDGNRLIRPIGDRVQRRYREALYAARKYAAFGFLDLAKNQVYFNVPTGATSSDIYVMEYDVYNPDNIRWTIHTYSQQAYSMGFFSRDFDLAWNSPRIDDTPWNTLHFSWKQGSIRSGFPLRVFGSTGIVYQMDDTLTTDAGTEYPSSWDSADFTIPQAMESFLGRWLEIELRLKGSAVTVSYSIDQGRQWTEVSSLILTGTYTLYTLPIDVVSRTFRIRIATIGSTKIFFMTWCRVWVRPGGAH